MKNKLGFTLIEMLVVVLIIGILAGIALPQYEMAVAKTRVASILPIMRRWKDALAEYKLQHGDYLTEDGNYPDADTLGVNWPSDWECYDDGGISCGNDYWFCEANVLFDEGEVQCGDPFVSIMFFQPDANACNGVPNCQNRITCSSNQAKGKKVCKSLGGELAEENEGWSQYLL